MRETVRLAFSAKAAARSAFESAKQRFFNHLITAMKTPTLIAAVERDLESGHAAVIQIVSTGEALMERRLAEIPAEDWGDVQVDITPREYVLDYLAHSFPTQLFEPFTDDDGNLSSRPVVRDGQPVQCRKAPLADPRRALGHLLGNGVRFGSVKAGVLLAGEGIETVLSLKCVLPGMPMIAALSANHLAALDLAPMLARLYVARDRDAAGGMAAERLHARGGAAGIDVRDLVPVWCDFNEDIRRLGPSILQTHLGDQLAPADILRFLGRRAPA
jgi:hypothetical protein